MSTLDVKNAFGCIEWATALSTMTRKAAKLAHPLAAMWRPGRIAVWLQDGAGQGWHVLHIYGSLVQGGQEAHPTFCLIIAVVIDETRKRLTVIGIWAFFWTYVDDITTQAAVSNLPLVLQVIAEELARFRCELQPRKCSVFVPAVTDSDQQTWPPGLAELANHIPVSTEGITLLGTDASGEHALPLGPWAVAAEPTRKRAAKACELARACLALARADPPPPKGGRRAAWSITRTIVCHSLDFDARVLPCSAVLPHAELVDKSALAVAEEVIGSPLSEQTRQQLSLPTRFAGMQWQCITDMLPMARVADLLENGPQLRKVLQAWWPDLTDPELRLLDGRAHSAELLEQLEALGVRLGPQGLPAAEAVADPLSSPCPARHLQSAYLAHKAAHVYDALRARGIVRDKVRLLSAAGTTSGSSLVSTAETNFTDTEWRDALRWRLGLHGPEGRCKNVASKDGERCNDVLGPEGDHALLCMTGPVRQAVHAEFADVLCEFIEEGGARARREAFVHEIRPRGANGRRQFTEAFLDVWGWGSADIPDLLVDVTWRHPMAARCLPRAETVRGFACQLAADDKAKQYPAAGGRAVHTFCVEGWGRLGSPGEAVLEVLAAAAATHDRRRGRETHSRLQRWRAHVDAVFQRGISRALDSARFGLPGRQRKP